MEENIAKVNEIEEIENVNDEIETTENSGSGALVAGMIGGFLAYAVISGGRKLVAFGRKKYRERKQKKVSQKVIDVDYVEVNDEQNNSGENDDE